MQLGQITYDPADASTLCTCGRAWGGITPPPPCPIHGLRPSWTFTWPNKPADPPKIKAKPKGEAMRAEDV